ncbi:pyridoxamine 5'-phosphate oxidase family protein [Liquorilactobacillus hordei]|uniref:pyridoxamine 5'-phosphate oxidase family protein n=1 Tax=Liquorilactobacillus hordei TaxID=468911 RepID=UPI000708FB1D|nr:pyridoxamine 5'-phosphate oxidase family protein [Liquorilactobacillus hordei]QYH51276.1 pyridoxamine 5'-phosphate oxidase family protein [Liquorilactobacillus hordei DSM 19519]
MYAKRFIQLFLIFLLTIFIAMLVVSYLDIKGYFVQSLALSVVGYIILVIPLTLLTILKQRKKFSKNGNSKSNSEFNNALSKLDNIIVLSTVSENNRVTSSVITFKQSRTEDNIFYIMTDSKTNRVRNIIQNKAAAITTWFDRKTGIRISSNNIKPEIIEGNEMLTEMAIHPEIKELSEDLKNNVIIKLTIHSALIESFQSSPLVVTFS